MKRLLIRRVRGMAAIGFVLPAVIPYGALAQQFAGRSPGVATLVINEQVQSITPDGSDVTSTGLHLTLADGGEILVSRAHAAIRDCATVTVQPTTWSGFKALYH